MEQANHPRPMETENGQTPSIAPKPKKYKTVQQTRRILKADLPTYLNDPTKKVIAVKKSSTVASNKRPASPKDTSNIEASKPKSSKHAEQK